MSELLKDGLVPNASRLMKDTRFQDWLLEVGIMKRSEDWQQVRPVWKKGGTDEILTDAERVVLDKLLTQRGYIAAHTQISSSERYATTFISRIRGKLENPELIVSHSAFGYSVGIESLRLRGGQVGRMFYRLWQDLGVWVAREELALGLYRYADFDEFHMVHTIVHRLRYGALAGTKVSILSYPEVSKGGYTLKEI